MTQAVMQADAQASTQETGFFPSRRTRGEVTLIYDPPYATELDDTVARHLVAYLMPAASLEYKARVWAAYAACRFDFLIDLGTRRVAIDYTDTPENLETALVEDNDALVLGAGVVDAVVRIRRSDLEERLYDCLHLLAKWDPALFTPYGQRVFASRASQEALEVFPEPEAGLATVYYETGPASQDADDAIDEETFEWPDAGEAGSMVLRRMTRDQPEYWKRQYERATLVYGRGPVRRLQHAS